MSENSRHSRPTQCERIIAYVNEFGSITNLEAIRDLGVMRLPSRITELKKKGYAVESKYVPCLNRWGEKCHVKEYKIGAPCNEQ